MNKPNNFKAIIAIIALAFSIAIKAHADPVSPVQTSDTLHLQPIKDYDPGKGNRMPGQHVYAFVTTTGNEMLLHFSQPVSCGIQMVNMEGQPVLTARMREEDIAILDVSCRTDTSGSLSSLTAGSLFSSVVVFKQNAST